MNLKENRPMHIFGRQLSRQSFEIAFVAAVVIFAGLLRIMDITTLSLWQDEAASWSQSNRSFFDMLVQTSRDNYPPLHNIILNVAIRYFGDSEFVLRMPSVILGTLAVYVTFLIGRQILGFRIGIGAAILLALSIHHIQYSTEARMYALLSFTSALFFYYSLKAVQGKLEEGYITLAGIALLYSHVYGAISFFSINFSVLIIFMLSKGISRQYLWEWFKSQFIAFVIFAPWVVILINRSLTPDSSGFGWIETPDVKFLLNEIIKLLSGYTTTSILVFLATIAIIWAISAPRFWKASSDIMPDESAALRKAVFMLVVWFILPIIIGYVLSIIYAPMIIRRYLIGAIVPMVVLASIGFYLLNLSRQFAIVSAVLILAAVAPSRSEFAPPNFRFDVRPDMVHFNESYQVGDTIYFLSWDVPLFIYYADDPTAVNIKPQNDLPADADLPKRFWVIGSGRYEPEDGMIEHLESLGYSMRYQTKTERLFFLFVKETGQ